MGNEVVGSDFAAITRSGNYNVVIGATEQDVEDKLGWIASHYEPHLPAERLDALVKQYRSGPLVGTPEQIVEKLSAADDMGMTYAICYFADAAYDPGSIELFQSQVIPALTS